MRKQQTHETYVHAVRAAALTYARAWTASRGDEALTGEQLARIEHTKLVYGRGMRGLRGITQFGAWKNGQVDELVEICALGQENWTQLAATTIHEMAHVAAGLGHGHDKVWRKACESLGLRRVKEGMTYNKANFVKELRWLFENMPKPSDGEPNMEDPIIAAMFKHRPCKAGQGVRGGKARGTGSGSRQRKYVCDKCGQIIRAGTDQLRASHQHLDEENNSLDDGIFVLCVEENKQGKAARAHKAIEAVIEQAFKGLPQ